MFLFFNKKIIQPEIVVSLFLSFLHILGLCSYKIILLKREYYYCRSLGTQLYILEQQKDILS